MDNNFKVPLETKQHSKDRIRPLNKGVVCLQVSSVSSVTSTLPPSHSLRLMTNDVGQVVAVIVIVIMIVVVIVPLFILHSNLLLIFYFWQIGGDKWNMRERIYEN